jgi:tetratricopeptide (TPR) repeat protein
MSNKKRKNKARLKQTARPRQALSGPQSARLQQATQAQSSGNLAYAESSYRALIAEKAFVPELYNNLALICAQSARPKEALGLWRQALAINPRFPDARMHLASAAEQSGDIDKAIAGYERVLADHPGMFLARYQLANVVKAQGKLDEATSHYEIIMQQQPGYTQAHFTYSLVHKYLDADDPHIGAMLGLYARKSLGVENQIHLAFSLAKAFEDIGDYPQAFRYLEQGNRLRHETFNYAIDSDEAMFKNIAEVFTRESMSRVQVDADPSSRPVFIVGMPRSGTTLVERILASHSDVYGAGELDYFYSLGVSNFLRASNELGFSSLDSYSKDAFEKTGRTYLDQINLLDRQASRVTDKLPFNFMMIGLIKIALPNAKIIHCVRDARDTCLSIYKQNFATENYRFAYDLKSVGQFHNLYRVLMEHWHQTLPGDIYDIEYEALTRNPEHEIRNLLSACELEWQDSCLHFDKSEGLVKTASHYQVRQPMYTSSVQLWERYREYLGPLLEVLREP